MKQPVRIVSAVLLVAFLAGLACLVLQRREPVWEGKPLSVWVEGLEGPGATRESHVKAAAAIRQMGTNSLPALLAMLRSEDSLLRQKLMPLLSRQRFIRLSFTPASLRHRRALFALDALGPSAAPAVPELILLLNATNVEIRCFAAQALGSLGAEEHIIVPALTNAIGDSDLRVRMAIEENLGRIGKEPGIAIPALIDRLSCTNTLEFQEVCLALKKFRPPASPAVPFLLKRYQDPDPAIRSAASDAVKRITGEDTGRATAGREHLPE